MNMENENNEFIVSGYKFRSEEDAKKTRDEVKKVSYIKSRLNYDEPESVLIIYEKLVAGTVLSTPVGYDLLRELSSFLLENGIEKGRISPLPEYSGYALNADRVRKDPAPRIVPAKPKTEYKGRFIISLIINIVLVLGIAAMLIIAISSDNPTILNYENALQDKYSAWEQDLSEREKAVREKEKELMRETTEEENKQE